MIEVSFRFWLWASVQNAMSIAGFMGLQAFDDYRVNSKSDTEVFTIQFFVMFLTLYCRALISLSLTFIILLVEMIALEKHLRLFHPNALFSPTHSLFTQTFVRYLAVLHDPSHFFSKSLFCAAFHRFETMNDGNVPSSLPVWRF